MSLLNDALRKNTSKAKINNTGYSDRTQFPPRKVSGRRICYICGLFFLLGSLVFGGWYFLGSLSAQVDSPVVVSSIAKHVEIKASNSTSETTGNHKKEVESMPDGLAPKGEIAPLEESVEIEPSKKSDRPTERRLENVPPPPAKKAKRKPRRLKKEAPRQAPEARGKPTPSRQEALFFKKALRYHRQGKLNQAIQLYQQVLRVKPDHRDALFNLASAYIRLTAYSEAYPLLKKLRSYDDRNPDVLVNLAIVEIGIGNSAEAIDYLDLAAKYYKNPKFEIHFHRAAALSRLGRLEEALISYKKAEELNPKHSTLNFNLALLCDKLQKYHEAADYYDEFLRQSDNLPRNEEKKIESRIRTLQAYLAGSRN